MNLFINGGFVFIVYFDREEDFLFGEFFFWIFVYLMVKKGLVGVWVFKEFIGFVRVYDLGEKCFVDYVKIFLFV